MANTNLFETVLETLPESAIHRRAWLALLLCFSRIERTLMQHFAQQYNSSLPRYDVLTALALNQSEPTMGELAFMLQVTKGNVTGVVRRLEQGGLVRKTTSKVDRRVQSVNITQKGRKLWEEMHRDYDRIISDILSDMSDNGVKRLTRSLNETLSSIEASKKRSS